PTRSNRRTTMAIKSITMYAALCDCCGGQADYGDFAAWADASHAIDMATDNEGWAEINNDLFCADCHAWAEDMPNYDPNTQEPDDEVRTHPNGCKETRNA